MKALIKSQRAMLDFISECSGWSSYANDSLTLKNIKCLVALGLIETNEFNQFRRVAE